MMQRIAELESKLSILERYDDINFALHALTPTAEQMLEARHVVEGIRGCTRDCPEDEDITCECQSVLASVIVALREPVY